MKNSRRPPTTSTPPKSSVVAATAKFTLVPSGGGQTVAVKKLYDNEKVVEQFNNEVAILIHIRHKNLVRLLGSCKSPRNPIPLLVYEFVPNGTVADHLCSRRSALTWDVRLQIATETADALAYLHSQEPPVIHRDVKTPNILLDNDLHAKVADFGICRLLPWDGTHVSTRTQGTVGYQDPEYERTLMLSDKYDVYSFGVVLLELISGMQAVDVYRGPDNIYLVDMAIKKIKNSRLEDIVDQTLGYHSDANSRRMINSVAELACECLHPEGKMRRTMVQVHKALTDIQNCTQVYFFSHNGLSQATESFHGSRYLGMKKYIGNHSKETTQMEQNPETSGSSLHSREQPESSRSSVKQKPHYTSRGLASFFTYEELEVATNNFSSKELGSGVYGKVYLGTLRGQTVAVKKLYDDEKLLQQFINEVTILPRIRRKNVINLLGFTNPRNPILLLVYEFVPNGTVADHLHRGRSALTWDVRLQIAVETADALAYLHSLEQPVIHRDVKTTSILLDNDLHVKLANFGICRLLPWNATHVSTRTQGTMGYRDPEFERTLRLSDKSDVYSFGVVLLELMSGMEAVDINEWPNDIYLVDRALKRIKSSTLKDIVDPTLGYHSDDNSRRMINSVAELACDCLHLEGQMRPTMVQVLEVLKDIQNRGP